MRVTLTLDLDNDDAEEGILAPTEIAREFGAALTDLDPIELDDGGLYFVTKVTNIHIEG